MIRVWRWVAFGTRPVDHAVREDYGAPARLEASACEGAGREVIQEVDGRDRCLACLRAVLGG